MAWHWHGLWDVINCRLLHCVRRYITCLVWRGGTLSLEDVEESHSCMDFSLNVFLKILVFLWLAGHWKGCRWRLLYFFLVFMSSLFSVWGTLSHSSSLSPLPLPCFHLHNSQHISLGILSSLLKTQNLPRLTGWGTYINHPFLPHPIPQTRYSHYSPESISILWIGHHSITSPIGSGSGFFPYCYCFTRFT